MKLEDIKTLLDAIVETLDCAECPCIDWCKGEICIVTIVEHIYKR